MRTSPSCYLSISNNGTPRGKPAVDPIDEWLWGAGYSERGRAYYPSLLLEPIPRWVKCVKCGKAIPPDEHVAFDGLAYYNHCLSAKFLHPEQEP